MTHADPQSRIHVKLFRLLGSGKTTLVASQVWAAEKLLQETPAHTLLYQLHLVPALAAGVQPGR